MNHNAMPDEPDKRDHAAANADNPFAVSSLFQGPVRQQQNAPPPEWFRVDGDSLICGPRVVLPATCVFGETEEELFPTQVDVVYPSLKFVLVARNCEVIYFRSRSARARSTLRSVLGGLGFLTGLYLLFMGAGFSNHRYAGTLAMSGVVVLISSIYAMSRRRPKLWLDRYDPPGIYYIKGFSEDFLSRLAQHPDHSPDVAQSTSTEQDAS